MSTQTKANANEAKANEAKAPIVGPIVPPTVSTEAKGEQVSMRPEATVRALLKFEDTGAITVPSGIKFEELATVSAEDAKAYKSAGLRIASVLRYARDSKEKVGEETAYAYVHRITLAAFIANGQTESAFYNVAGLQSAIDFVLANNSPVSPHVAKECLGYLKKCDFVDKDTLKLEKGTASDSVVKALKNGTAKSNAVRDTVQKAKVGKPDLFPKEAAAHAKKLADEAAKKANGGKKPEVVTKLEPLDIEVFNRNIESMCAQLGKIWEANPGKIEELRKKLTHAEAFARMCGVVK